MSRWTTTIGLAVALGGLAGAARGDDFSLGFPRDAGGFNVLAGRPVLLRPGEQGPPGNAIDWADGGRLIHFASHKPLAYSLSGDAPTVRLGAEPATSSRWDLSGVSDDRRGGPVRAAEGRWKGWYLDWSDEEEELVVDGATYHVRRLTLVENPPAPRRFRKYPVSK